MPGIIWLALNPPGPGAFPWWTGYALDAMSAVGLAMIGFLVFVYAKDAVTAWRKRRPAPHHSPEDRR